MVALLRALIEAHLGAHLAHGTPVSFSWAVYNDQDGRVAVALAPSNPPIWEGDHDGLEQAKMALAHDLNAANVRTDTLPSTGLTSAAWCPSSAHDRLAHRKRARALALEIKST